MHATIFDIYAILSLFSITIHAAPVLPSVRYAPPTLLECPIKPVIGIGPVCSPWPTQTPPYDWCWKALFIIPVKFLTGLKICRLGVEGYGDQNMYMLLYVLHNIDQIGFEEISKWYVYLQFKCRREWKESFSSLGSCFSSNHDAYPSRVPFSWWREAHV